MTVRSYARLVRCLRLALATGAAACAPSGPAEDVAPSDAASDSSNVSPVDACMGLRLTARRAVEAQHCQGYVAPADGGLADAAASESDAAAVAPATCSIDCVAACTGVYLSGLGLSQPWSGAGPATGSGQCQRIDATSVECFRLLPCGREPDGLVRAQGLPSPATVSGWLAHAAQLEAAAVLAFELMQDELRALGAPEHLLEQARASAQDERRHARQMRALLRRRGLPTSAAPEVQRRARGVFEIALENCAEGCVRETYGALLAQHQAAHAQETDVRAVFSTLADDEARHAALSWELHRWLIEQLPNDERSALRVEQQRAWDALLTSLEEEPSAEQQRALGLPSAEVARTMASKLRAVVSQEFDCN
jgi:hypothetical protein